MSGEESNNNLNMEIYVALLALKEGLTEHKELLHSTELDGIQNLIDAIDKAVQTKFESDVTDALKLIFSSPKIRLKFIRSIQQTSGDLRIALSKEGSLKARIFPEEEYGFSYICPVDPEHYQKETLLPDDKLTCPLHNVSLIPQKKNNLSKPKSRDEWKI